MTGVTDVTKAQKVWGSLQSLGDIAFAYSYSMILIEIQVLIYWISLTSAPETLIKHSKIKNYSLRKLNIFISNILITHIFIKIYHFKLLKSSPGTH